MDLKFEIKDNQILRKNIQVLASENTKCSFDFQTEEWNKCIKENGNKF